MAMGAATLVSRVKPKVSLRPHLIPRPCHQYIKYMGSKAKLLEFIVGGLNEVYDGGPVCDLFAGSAILSAAIGHNVEIYSNDIQAYSSVLAGAYLNSWRSSDTPTGEELAAEANLLVKEYEAELPTGLGFEKVTSLESFNRVDNKNRSLLNNKFSFKWHLFTKCYSGTWWSAEQCLWIDALRQIAEKHANKPYYDTFMASLMHAMAYCSQGTGHFAQYRDATSQSSLRDILIYRRRSVSDYFIRKYDQAVSVLANTPTVLKHELTSFDFEKRLKTLPSCTIYADPPYCFVHYSRFYHALETLVKYDFPNLQIKGGSVVKGRYREDRHQSPFSIHSQVPAAFRALFEGVAASESNIVLSYSNTGMITREELMDIAKERLGASYSLKLVNLDHTHMTMGRRNDRDREVKECLIIGKR